MSGEITVVIPSIPPRRELLGRALRSVSSQTLPAAAVAIAFDLDRAGAARTRQRALDMVRTDLVAFLDDDDEFLPQHLEKLHAYMLESGADLVFSWFEVVGGRDPFPIEFSYRQWDNETWQQHTTIVTLVRTELAQEVGFWKDGDTIDFDRPYTNEDLLFVRGCQAHGAKILRISERTWRWHHTGSNTSGRPDRW